MPRLKDFFYLQRNDRQALLTILSVMIASLLLIWLLGREEEPNSKNATTDSVLIKQATPEHPLYYKVDGTSHALFPFDPNTADSTELLKLGLTSWQVRSIYRYRAKDGQYRNANDFAQLYGLTKKQFETLRPFIRISEAYRPASDFYHREHYHESKKENRHADTTFHYQNKEKSKSYSYPQKIKLGQHIAINTADTTDLKTIPGIGSGYAKAIIRYRERLGGYVSSQQLLEIDGFPEEALVFITIDESMIKKINVNQLTLSQLRRHPYINFYQAKEICDYRRLRGPLKSLQELKLLRDFPPEEIERLQPYVCF